LGIGGVQYFGPAAAEAAVETAATQTAPTRLAALPDFSALVEQYGPAVVNISVTHEPQARTGAAIPDFGMQPGDPFHEFFRRFGIPQPPQGGAPSQGVGSGF